MKGRHARPLIKNVLFTLKCYYFYVISIFLFLVDRFIFISSYRWQLKKIHIDSMEKGEKEGSEENITNTFLQNYICISFSFAGYICNYVERRLLYSLCLLYSPEDIYPRILVNIAILQECCINVAILSQYNCNFLCLLDRIICV